MIRSMLCNRRNIEKIHEMWRISIAFAKFQFAAKNEGTWLGVLWHFLTPFLTFVLLFFLFKDRLGTEIPLYPLYLIIGILLFNYFRAIANQSVSIILRRGGLVKSIKFPTECLILGIVFEVLLTHFFEIVVVIGFLLYFKVPITALLFYPVILFFLTIFSIGFSLFLSAIRVYFFDLAHIWPYVATAMWFITPIFYSAETKVFMLVNAFNPMFHFITVTREVIVYARVPDPSMVFSLIGYSIASFLIGLLVFRKLKGKFAEFV